MRKNGDIDRWKEKIPNGFSPTAIFISYRIFILFTKISIPNLKAIKITT